MASHTRCLVSSSALLYKPHSSWSLGNWKHILISWTAPPPPMSLHYCQQSKDYTSPYETPNINPTASVATFAWCTKQYYFLGQNLPLKWNYHKNLQIQNVILVLKFTTAAHNMNFTAEIHGNACTIKGEKVYIQGSTYSESFDLKLPTHFKSRGWGVGMGVFNKDCGVTQ